MIWARPLIMFGNPLRAFATTPLSKGFARNTVEMPYPMVTTQRIGQSAGKDPKHTCRVCMGLPHRPHGGRLQKKSLRYSQSLSERLGVVWYGFIQSFCSIKSTLPNDWVSLCSSRFAFPNWLKEYISTFNIFYFVCEQNKIQNQSLYSS